MIWTWSHVSNGIFCIFTNRITFLGQQEMYASVKINQSELSNPVISPVIQEYFLRLFISLQVGRNRNKTKNQFTMSKDNKRKMQEVKWFLKNNIVNNYRLLYNSLSFHLPHIYNVFSVHEPISNWNAIYRLYATFKVDCNIPIRSFGSDANFRAICCSVVEIAPCVLPVSIIFINTQAYVSTATMIFIHS